MPGKGTGKKALIEFKDADEAQWLVENLNGNIPEGLTTPVVVQMSGSKGAKGAGKDTGKAGKLGGKDAGKGCWGKADGGKGKSDFGPYGKGKNGKDFGGKNGKDGGKGTSMKGLLKGAVKGGLTPYGERPLENQLYFRGLPTDCTDRDLYELCAPFGAIPPKGVLAQQRDGECIGSG